MKFCSNCGNQMDDSTKFCILCGAAQEETQKKTKKKRKKLWLIPVIIGGVCLVGLSIFISVSVAYESSAKEGTIKKALNATAEMDTEATVDVMWSKSMLKLAEEMDDTDDMIDTYEEDFELLEYYDIEFKFKNLEIEDMHDVEKADVKEFVEAIEDEYDVKVSIQKMCEIEISYEFWNNNYEEWDDAEEECIVYKSSGKWYYLDKRLQEFYDEVIN